MLRLMIICTVVIASLYVLPVWHVTCVRVLMIGTGRQHGYIPKLIAYANYLKQTSCAYANQESIETKWQSSGFTKTVLESGHDTHYSICLNHLPYLSNLMSATNHLPNSLLSTCQDDYLFSVNEFAFAKIWLKWFAKTFREDSFSDVCRRGSVLMSFQGKIIIRPHQFFYGCKKKKKLFRSQNIWISRFKVAFR